MDSLNGTIVWGKKVAAIFRRENGKTTRTQSVVEGGVANLTENKNPEHKPLKPVAERFVFTPPHVGFYRMGADGFSTGEDVGTKVRSVGGGHEIIDFLSD